MSTAFYSNSHRLHLSKKRTYRPFFLKTVVFSTLLTVSLCGFLGGWMLMDTPIHPNDQVLTIKSESASTAMEPVATLPEEQVLPIHSDATQPLPVTQPESKPIESPTLDVTAYDFTKALPLSTPITNDYFKDAVFIGNSQTEGFMLYSGLTDTTVFTDRGLKVDTVFTKKVISLDHHKMPIMEALGQNTSFNKVYLLFGINELGWAYSSEFVKQYGKVIDAIRVINPNTIIYIQSILPISEKKSKSNDIYTKKNIDAYNLLILQLATDKQAYYVDMQEALAAEDGYLPVDSSYDGIHLKQPYCERWLAYLQSHTVEGALSAPIQ